MKAIKCCLCKRMFNGYGNNAEPLAKGMCCDDCNIDVVVARIKNVFPHKKSLVPTVENITKGVRK